MPGHIYYKLHVCRLTCICYISYVISTDCLVRANKNITSTERKSEIYKAANIYANQRSYDKSWNFQQQKTTQC